MADSSDAIKRRLSQMGNSSQEGPVSPDTAKNFMIGFNAPTTAPKPKPQNR